MKQLDQISFFHTRKIQEKKKAPKIHQDLNITLFLETNLHNKPEQAASNPNAGKYFGNMGE